MQKQSFPTTRETRQAPSQNVLCVDLDGTLIPGDLLYESLLLLAKQNPLALLLLPLWLLQGRAALKRRIAERIRFDASALAYNDSVLDYLREQKRNGRALALATASDKLLADAVARHLEIFSNVLASDGRTNLKGNRKQKVLEERFGERGFDYVGDSPADVVVWRSAANGIVVGDSASLTKQARRACNITDVIPSAREPFLKAVVRSLRLHHWSKNLLLFLPLLLAHKIEEPARLLHAAIAFLCFGFCASSIYVLNDLLDLQSDRKHPWKSRRPFASSALSIPFGFFLFAALLIGSLTASYLLLPGKFTAMMACYALLSVLYSTKLKRMLLLDVMLLASFYALRIFAGGLAVQVKLSYWLIAFAMFFFFSLAMAKRYSELVHASDLIESGHSGRSYLVDDRAALSMFGVSSGYLSVLVIALYINSTEIVSMYHRPDVLWLICPLILYWISRIWMLAHRGQLCDDPVVIAMHDKISYIVGALAAIVIVCATPMS